MWFYPGAFRSRDKQHRPWHRKARHDHWSRLPAVNLGVFRNFRIWERVTFQFRAEASTRRTTPTCNRRYSLRSGTTFGEITGYRDARILQFAGKFTL